MTKRKNATGAGTVLLVASAVVLWMLFNPSAPRRSWDPIAKDEPDRLRELGAA